MGIVCGKAVIESRRLPVRGGGVGKDPPSRAKGWGLSPGRTARRERADLDLIDGRENLNSIKACRRRPYLKT